MKKQTQLGDGVPGGIYLCQVNEHVSCGACCGLYNVPDPSHDSLIHILTRRSDAFECIPREVGAILNFANENEAAKVQGGPFSEFHHCPFIGLIGKNRGRVGCLLHPESAGNNGVDFRGLSFYGAMACRVYFCPSHRCLSRVVKSVIKAAATDWYLYGLVITEAAMLNAFFGAIQKRVKRFLSSEELVENETGIQVVREFLALKRHWPFRSGFDAGYVHYFFEDQLYPKPPVKYAGSKTRRSRFHTIFREMVSSFESEDALIEAEALMENLIHRIVSCVL